MEYARGGGLGTENPWHSQRGTFLVWDASWFGGVGLWARDDETSPPISRNGTTHVISGQEVWEHIPLIRWINPFDGFSVDLLGRLEILWSGNNGVGEPVEVDVAVALRDLSENSVDV
jgi:hypothetical protein